jgi:nicotinic acid mononucleotide adenylyltransferase
MAQAGVGDLIEKTNNSVVYAFGRFQPPTTGHQLVIEKVIAEAARLGADAYIFPSSKQNDMAKYSKRKNFGALTKKNSFASKDVNENPLSIGQKIAYLKKAYPSVKFVDTSEGACGCGDPFKASGALEAAGYSYDAMTLVAGGDRVDSYQALFARYERPVKVVSAGARAANPISGTAMRKAAVNGDFEAFRAGVSVGAVTPDDVRGLMNQVREGLGFGSAEGGARRRGRSLRVRPKRSGSKRSGSKRSGTKRRPPCHMGAF